MPVFKLMTSTEHDASEVDVLIYQMISFCGEFFEQDFLQRCSRSIEYSQLDCASLRLFYWLFRQSHMVTPKTRSFNTRDRRDAFCWTWWSWLQLELLLTTTMCKYIEFLYGRHFWIGWQPIIVVENRTHMDFSLVKKYQWVYYYIAGSLSIPEIILSSGLESSFKLF